MFKCFEQNHLEEFKRKNDKLVEQFNVESKREYFFDETEISIDLKQQPQHIVENAMEMSQVMCKESKTHFIMYFIPKPWINIVSDILQDKQLPVTIKNEIEKMLNLPDTKRSSKIFLKDFAINYPIFLNLFKEDEENVVYKLAKKFEENKQTYDTCCKKINGIKDECLNNTFLRAFVVIYLYVRPLIAFLLSKTKKCQRCEIRYMGILHSPKDLYKISKEMLMCDKDECKENKTLIMFVHYLAGLFKMTKKHEKYGEDIKSFEDDFFVFEQEKEKVVEYLEQLASV